MNDENAGMISKSENLRCGLIGIGHHGIRYANYFQTSGKGATLVAVSCRSESSGRLFARERDVAWYQDYRLLIDDPLVDVVLAVVPPQLHAEICTYAMNRGKPVLVEKPFAHTVDAARDILRTAQERHARIMVAHTLRFDPIVRELRDHIHRVGRLSTVFICQRFGKAAASWVDEEGARGTLFITGVHGFDLVRTLTGREVEDVSCFAARMLTAQSDDTAVVIMRLRGGAPVACIETTRASGGRDERIEIVGEACQLVANLTTQELVMTEGRTRSELAVDAAIPGIVRCLDEFLAATRDARPYPVTLEDALQAVVIGEACYQANAQERVVRLAEFAR